MSKTVYELINPIEWGSDGSITKLEFRPAKVKDLKGLNLKKLGEDPEQMVLLLSRLADVEQAVIYEMTTKDLNALSEMISDFL